MNAIITVVGSDKVGIIAKVTAYLAEHSINIIDISEYFMGKDNALYIIYAYGNLNHTSEMDIVVM